MKSNIFEIDLDYDFNIDFIYRNTIKKPAKINKVDNINFAQVYEDDF